ncbi:GFA family protein [Pararhizobium mangrovi]|uniref:GFA family protein n=1 Tax=Pararhizobium mangrovi TaxID=2590452 RepID=A0A506U8J8_9HYPH|nr:GFA family protein [Pararhizobium mangrovi]TPW29295.1 GFA family protein [Pararhizobium mangrovi]
MAKQDYQGGCQCGAVRYRVSVDLDRTFECNCSRCGRLGSIFAFTGADDFELLSGEEALGEYRFNTKTIAHLFCTICGIESFARGEKPGSGPTVAINARCLDGVDPSALQPSHVDGLSA